MGMTNLDNISASTPFSLVEIILLLIILNSVIIFQDFYSSYRFILHFLKQIISHIGFAFPGCWKRLINKKNVDENCNNRLEAAAESSNAAIPDTVETEKPMMTLEEVKMTIDEEMGRVEEIIDFEGMFDEEEEEEISLEEVKQVFGVFDENGDGFIDASELRNVLSGLSFREASEAECGRMICAFDDDKDGRIGFNEFLKLMECSFSS